METINKKNFFLVFFFITLFAFLAFFLFTNSASKNIFQIENIKYVKISGQIIKVDLALTLETQSQGLSGRKSLKEDEGMLFIFKKPEPHYFWMKDMNFPIDIIWLGEDLKVVYVEKNAQPISFPTTFGPKEDSKYVLEVISGFSEKNNLKEGNKVEFLP